MDSGTCCIPGFHTTSWLFALWSLANKGYIHKNLGHVPRPGPDLTTQLPGTKSQAGAAVFHPFSDKLYFYPVTFNRDLPSQLKVPY